ncbi:helix-turn-helix domain-containing protein [Loigolactobacillus bifermentans]|jgi:DNA-binding transcriptional regulator YiaG|nr:helix-turn-helix transcriptional regulator [Loigolactobacillus bifermentans]QGG61298.1 helix-turn-helix domain-containing protein [Loigolactobacillus bifermentans]
MKVQTALTKIKAYDAKLAQTLRGSEAFNQIDDAYDAFVYRYLRPRDAVLISQQLGRPLTTLELARLVTAAYNQTDLTATLPLTPEVKLGLALKFARRQRQLTQQDVAIQTGITQSQVAKAETAQTTLSLSNWQALFKAVDFVPAFQFGR